MKKLYDYIARQGDTIALKFSSEKDFKAMLKEAKGLTEFSLKGKDTSKNGYNFKNPNTGALIIAEGEHTGNNHEIRDTSTVEVLGFDDSTLDSIRRIFIKVNAPTIIDHWDVTTDAPTREHDPVALPKEGFYEIRTRRNVAIDEQLGAIVRRVAD